MKNILLKMDDKNFFQIVGKLNRKILLKNRVCLINPIQAPTLNLNKNTQTASRRN